MNRQKKELAADLAEWKKMRSDDTPEVHLLDTGFLYVRWNAECFAQFPKDFSAPTVPDKYIFNPEWNRGVVNRWWMARTEEGLGC